MNDLAALVKDALLDPMFGEEAVSRGPSKLERGIFSGGNSLLLLFLGRIGVELQLGQTVSTRTKRSRMGRVIRWT